MVKINVNTGHERLSVDLVELTIKSLRLRTDMFQQQQVKDGKSCTASVAADEVLREAFGALMEELALTGVLDARAASRIISGMADPTAYYDTVLSESCGKPPDKDAFHAFAERIRADAKKRSDVLRKWFGTERKS